MISQEHVDEFNKEIELQSHPTEEELKEAAEEVAVWIEEALKNGHDVKELISALPNLFWLLANDAIYDYEIHSCMGGMGGCLPLKEWLEISEDRPFFKLIKSIYHKRVLKGWHKHLFRLAMHGMGCTLAVNFLMRG